MSQALYVLNSSIMPSYGNLKIGHILDALAGA